MQVRQKTFTLFCVKFIKDTAHQILSESSTLCRRCDENICRLLFYWTQCIIRKLVI